MPPHLPEIRKDCSRTGKKDREREEQTDALHDARPEIAAIAFRPSRPRRAIGEEAADRGKEQRAQRQDDVIERPHAGSDKHCGSTPVCRRNKYVRPVSPPLSTNSSPILCSASAVSTPGRCRHKGGNTQ